ncbi:MAG: porin [Methylophilaceae bacterium]|nr:porin [Methyloradius sp.]
MNKKLSLAVAGAVLALGASAANAGIVIPAGDWTVDIGGNVNAYYQNSNYSGALSASNSNVISTGLLPSALGIGAKTRQNDLDIAFQFTFFTGVDAGSNNNAGSGGNVAPGSQGALGGNTLNVRQAFLTFGDASWGTIKAGRDLGIYASDAILSDMTLLGVGGAAGGGGNSTLGRIGSGYIYADWVGQISYTSPNWNGFSFAVGVREPWTNKTNGTSDDNRNNMGYEGKVSYEWAGDYAGKVWSSAITQKYETNGAGVAGTGYTARGIDVGAKIAIADFGLVGYYYDGKGLSGGANLLNGLPFLGGTNADVNGGYVQGTYKVPGVGTKLGLSWGESKVDGTTAGQSEYKDESWIVGAYHPLTKSLNLVAEYSDHKVDGIGNVAGADGKIRTMSLGAILFF